MAKKKQPRKRREPRKAPDILDTVYKVIAILAGITNIVYTVYQMFKAS